MNYTNSKTHWLNRFIKFFEKNREYAKIKVWEQKNAEDANQKE